MPELNAKRRAKAEANLLEMKRQLGTLIGETVTQMHAFDIDYTIASNVFSLSHYPQTSHSYTQHQLFEKSP